MRLGWVLGLGAIAFATDANASHHRHRHAHAPPAPHASYFLAADPHVPLAVVRGAHVRDAVRPSERGTSCGSHARWRARGSRWRALDAWGQVIATSTVASFDDYDVTHCAEIGFAGAPKHDDTMVYVSEDSAWRPSPPVSFTPSAYERAAFEAMIPNGHQQTTQRCTSISERARFFEVGARRFAVGGGSGGWIVASLARGTWTREQGTLDSLCYRPVAVFDMNGDGVPEIVMRSAEPASWDDFVIERGARGWTIVARSPGGSTA